MSGELPGALALRLHSVCYRYGRSRAVDDVDLRVEPGERVALGALIGAVIRRRSRTRSVTSRLIAHRWRRHRGGAIDSHEGNHS